MPVVSAFLTAVARSDPKFPGSPAQVERTSAVVLSMKFGFEVLLKGTAPAPVKPPCGEPGTVVMLVPVGAETMMPRTMTSNRLMP